MTAVTQDPKQKALKEVRDVAERYHGLKGDLSEVRDEMIEAMVAASASGASQEEIAQFATFDDERHLHRTRIQQFLREGRRRLTK